MRIVLGEETDQSKVEAYLDGQFEVVSRDGLHRNQRSIVPVLPKNKTGRALVINSDYALLAFALRAANPGLEITCHYDDAWDADLARALVSQYPESKFEVSIAADPPEGPWQFIVMPLERRGIADLVRERIRLAASGWLAPQGLLITSSDTKDDRFIRDEVKKAFGALHIAPEERRAGGVAYVARNPAKALISPPHTWYTYTVREVDETLTFHSRLGVFCHDRIDPGTRALLALMDVAGAKRILDLGCGSGVVGIVAAMRNPGVKVTFLDSAARAIQSTQRNVEEHKLTQNTDGVLLSADPIAAVEGRPKYDLVLSNPPYYGNWRIAELFLETARRTLAPGGRIQIVTKAPHWYHEQLVNGFSDVKDAAKGGYTIVTATRT